MRARNAFRSTLAGAALGLFFVTTAHTAHAQDVAAAANAFSRAQKAELAGDHDSAAELYELADSLAPAPEALRSALRARKAAGQLGSAATHAEHLIHRYPDDKRSKELAEQTLDEAKKKLARYEIKCQPKACGVMMNGAAATSEISELHVVYIEPGDHDVGAIFNGEHVPSKHVTGKAGDRLALVFDAPPERKPTLAAGGGFGAGAGTAGADTVGRGPGARRGLPVWVFLTGAVITAGVGAVTVWSGLDVLKAHDAYVASNPQTQTDYEDGISRQRRTNVLIGGTVVAGVSTGIIAVFTRWGGSGEPKTGNGAPAAPRLDAGASVFPSGAGFTLRGTF